jgi:hypothetical protein
VILGLIQCSGIGTQRRQTTAIIFDDEIQIYCGCFTGSIAEFDAKIKQTHAENLKYLQEYQATVAWILACAAAMRESCKSLERSEV